MVVDAGVGVGAPQLAAGHVWWSESRPHEGGRVQLVQRPVVTDLAAPPSDAIDGGPRDVLPDSFSARSRLHEYGGGAWWATNTAVVFTEATDQRLWWLPLGPGGQPAGEPVPLTPPGNDRHADPRPLADRWWVCVREPDGGHSGGDELVAVRVPAGDNPQGAGDNPQGAGDDPQGLDSAGTQSTGESSEVHVLHRGPDFLACPRVSPCGRWLAWLQWDLPHMPWETTSLWVAGIDTTGDGPPVLAEPELVLGGDGVSLAQPGWFPDGRLAVVSDDDNWWNLWVFDEPGRPTPHGATQLSVVAGELAPPQWVAGQSTWGVTDTGQVVGSWRADGHDHIGVIDTGGDEVHWVHSGHLGVEGLAVVGDTVALTAGSFTVAAHVVVATVDDVLAAAVAGVHIPLAVHRPPDDPGVGAGWLVAPEAITVTTGDGHRVHTLVYPPHHPDMTGPGGTPGPVDPGGAWALPPLMVLIHGGPTGSARPALSMAVQFWTSRGWTVAEVNYRGSTGYGRRYRNLLCEAWGVVDVDDCIAVARWLADNGRADPDRMVIRGGSAGGFTALSALVRSDVFAGGAVRYPVVDLAALDADSHRFESGYNDWLVGPPQDKPERYAQRSPVHHLDAITAPLLVLCGSDDPVVPPSQADAVVASLTRRQIPVVHKVFDGEGHGFRRADTLRRALEAEQAFFADLVT